MVKASRDRAPNWKLGTPAAALYGLKLMAAKIGLALGLGLGSVTQRAAMAAVTPSPSPSPLSNALPPPHSVIFLKSWSARRRSLRLDSSRKSPFSLRVKASTSSNSEASSGRNLPLLSLRICVRDFCEK